MGEVRHGEVPVENRSRITEDDEIFAAENPLLFRRKVLNAQETLGIIRR